MKENLQSETVTHPSQPVFVIDDEIDSLISIEALLRFKGINNITVCQDSRQAIPLLSKREPSIVLLDLIMPNLRGEDLLKEIVEDFPEIPVIVITGLNDVKTAVECMKMGAYDYLTKPIDENLFFSVIQKTVDNLKLKWEIRRLKEQVLNRNLENTEAFSSIITKNSSMLSVFQYIEAIGKGSEPVLITGESGVGKELIAQAIHKMSGRKGEFVPVNVAGLDDTVFADTLFGHKKGAFTGADKPRVGMVEKASGGTLFLDEIGDISPDSQKKLLRLLQEKEYFPLGSDLPFFSKARIVAATNADFKEFQVSGKFRRDLYYRLETHHINIPPLRERKEDLPMLVEHFLREASREFNKRKPTVPLELYALLSAYNFPGNIRELRSMVFDAVSQHRSKVLSLKHFKLHMFPDGWGKGKNPKKVQGIEAQRVFFSRELPLPTKKEMKDILYNEALKRANGVQATAAKLLGISAQALNKYIKSPK